MAHPLRNMRSALYQATDRLILRTIVVVPQYLRYRVHHALHAAELRRARRRRVALAGGSAAVAVGVVALRNAKHGNDH
jgi:hypothetical protein